MRAIVFLYTTGKIIYDIVLLAIRTFTILSYNWWQDPDEEDFVTNCSVLTAVICWIIWLVCIAATTVFILSYLFSLIRTARNYGCRFLIRDHCDQIAEAIRFYCTTYRAFIYGFSVDDFNGY